MCAHRKCFSCFLLSSISQTELMLSRLLALINMSDSQDLSFLKSQNFDLDIAVSGTTPTAG